MTTPPLDPLASAPLLRALHADHPDVDLVILPEDAQTHPRPLDDGADHRSVAVEQHETEQVATWMAREIADTVTGRNGPGTNVTRHRTWQTGEYVGTVRPVIAARVEFAPQSPTTRVQDTTIAALTSAGWTHRLVRGGPVTRVHGEHDGRDLRAVWLDDAVLVTVWGLPVAVGEQTARALLTGRGLDHA